VVDKSVPVAGSSSIPSGVIFLGSGVKVESGLFWKIWPLYVKFFCPVAILIVFFQ